MKSDLTLVTMYYDLKNMKKNTALLFNVALYNVRFGYKYNIFH